MTEVAPVIHICGFPGSGKFTIALCLAKRICGKLLHNHLAIEPASALFAREDQRHGDLRRKLQKAIFKAARDLEPSVPIIITNAFQDTRRDRRLFAQTEKLAQDRGAQLRCITLEISLEENRRRLMAPERANRHKLTSIAVLEHLRQTCTLLKPSGAVSLDVTGWTAEQASEGIIEVLNLPDRTDHA